MYNKFSAHHVKYLKAKQLKSLREKNKPKGMKRAVNIGYKHLCLRQENITLF
jgi:hypothetical protein